MFTSTGIRGGGLCAFDGLEQDDRLARAGLLRGKLVYAGRVGTGFTHKAAGDLLRQLNPMVIAASPFAKKLPAKEAKGVRFVRPEVVGEVEFRAWTAEGYVRHGSFRGLREDKLAGEVVRERVAKNREASK